MVTVKLILEYLQTLAPVDYKEQWDNVGLPVSYTHLDVYKRQIEYRAKILKNYSVT